VLNDALRGLAVAAAVSHWAARFAVDAAAADIDRHHLAAAAALILKQMTQPPSSFPPLPQIRNHKVVPNLGLKNLQGTLLPKRYEVYAIMVAFTHIQQREP
jgi:hypothetical protein